MTGKLEIDKSVFDAMLSAARKAAPLEACGLLAGANGRASRLYVLANADASREHFSILPDEQFAAVLDMRANGSKLLSIWHSHPETPPRMSEEDIRLAYTPDVFYTILSLADPDAPAIEGFMVQDGVAHRIELTIVHTPEDKTTT